MAASFLDSQERFRLNTSSTMETCAGSAVGSAGGTGASWCFGSSAGAACVRCLGIIAAYQIAYRSTGRQQRHIYIEQRIDRSHVEPILNILYVLGVHLGQNGIESFERRCFETYANMTSCFSPNAMPS